MSMCNRSKLNYLSLRKTWSGWQRAGKGGGGSAYGRWLMENVDNKLQVIKYRY